ncbi:transcriptional regulator [Oscillospiraceae bacterium]|nr:transcriptional regulator [Oscillospiraceae bacterium]
METRMIFSVRIRNLRTASGYSQQQIAKFLQVAPNTYSRYECGKILCPLDMVIRLAQYFHTSVDYLAGLTDTPAPHPRRKSP